MDLPVGPTARFSSSLIFSYCFSLPASAGRRRRLAFLTVKYCGRLRKAAVTASSLPRGLEDCSINASHVFAIGLLPFSGAFSVPFSQSVPYCYTVDKLSPCRFIDIIGSSSFFFHFLHYLFAVTLMRRLALQRFHFMRPAN